MRRDKDDKRVLRSGNGRQDASRRNVRRSKKRNKFNNRQFRSGNQVRNKNRNKKKRKTSGTVVLIMIVALIAFVIGAGMGVSLSFEDDSVDKKPQFENVTKEMTTGLNNTSQVSYDKEIDGADYNENVTSQLNVGVSNNEEYQ